MQQTIQSSSAPGQADMFNSGSAPTTTSAKKVAKRHRFYPHFDTLRGQFSWLVLLCLLTTIGGLVGFFAILNSVTDNLNEIVNNSAPSILAAEQLAQAIEDADAKAADYQLYSRIGLVGDSSGFNTKLAQTQAWDTILKRRRDTTEALFTARTNITYPGEAETIDLLNQKISAYNGKIDIMRDLLDKGRWEEALVAYKAGRDILTGNANPAITDFSGRSPEEQAKLAGWPKFDTKRTYEGIEANARKLFEINNVNFEKSRQAGFDVINFLIGLSIALSLLMITTLTTLSLRTTFLMHRVFNPGYFPAVLLTIIVAVVLITNILQARQDYQTVARDSFGSMEVIASLRLLATDSNADESRLLLLPDINSNSSVLTDTVRRAFRSEMLEENFVKKQALIRQEIQKLFSNVTYKGEFEALCKLTANPNPGKVCGGASFILNEYLRLDGAIRENLKQQKLVEAIRLNTGPSNDTFAKWENTLLELNKINEVEFNRGTCTSLGYLRFSVSCQALGYKDSYLPFMQLAIWIVFPLIAFSLLTGFWLAWRKS